MALDKFTFTDADWDAPSVRDSRYWECLTECLRCKGGAFIIPPMSDNRGQVCRNFLQTFDTSLRSIIGNYFNPTYYTETWSGVTFVYDWIDSPYGPRVKINSGDQWSLPNGGPYAKRSDPLNIKCFYSPDGSGISFVLTSSVPPRWTIDTISYSAGMVEHDWAIPVDTYRFDHQMLSNWIRTRKKILTMLQYDEWEASTCAIQISASDMTYRHRTGQAVGAGRRDNMWGTVFTYEEPYHLHDNGNRDDYEFGYSICYDDYSGTAGVDCNGVRYDSQETQTGNCQTWGAWSAWSCEYHGGGIDTTDCAHAIFPIPDPPNNVDVGGTLWYYSSYSWNYGEMTQQESYQCYGAYPTWGYMHRERTCSVLEVIPASATPWLDSISVLCEGSGAGAGCRLSFTKSASQHYGAMWGNDPGPWWHGMFYGTAESGEVTANWTAICTINGVDRQIGIPYRYTIVTVGDGVTCEWSEHYMVTHTPASITAGYAGIPPQIPLGEDTGPTAWTTHNFSCSYSAGFYLTFDIAKEMIPFFIHTTECFNEN